MRNEAPVSLPAPDRPLPAWDWNAQPRHINEARERLWQWRDAQFLRGWREGLHTGAPAER